MKTVCMLAAIMTLGISAPAMARCYQLSATPVTYRFCVKGDGFAARKTARTVCRRALRKKCGKITRTETSCNTGHCFDARGRRHSSLSGY